MKKVVVKVSVRNEKEKQKAMNAVSGLSGIESLALDMEDQKLTIIGDIDPVDVVSILRKNWYTEIISFGEPEKKKEEAGKKDEKKDESEAEQEVEDLIKASRNYYYPYHPCIQPYYCVSQPEYPNACVIC